MWHVHAHTKLYLRSLGWQVDNDMFAKHSWYFRNALVRANYHNVQKGIDYTFTYLERFFRNLLLGEDWDLRSRYLHIAAPEQWRVQPQLSKKTSVQSATQSINVGINVAVDAAVKLTERQRIIYQLLNRVSLDDTVSETVKWTAQAIADYTHIPVVSVKRYLAELVNMGVIRRVGSDKTGHWEIIKEIQL